MRYSFKDLEDYIERLAHISNLSRAGGKSRFSAPMQYLDSKGVDFLLIGGLALSFYSPARMTEDIDVLLRNETDLKKLKDLTAGEVKWIRNHAFLFDGIEVEILTPEFVKIPQTIADYVFETRKQTDSFYIPSEEGIILLKLISLRDKDKNDIQSILKSQGPKIDVLKIYQLVPSKEAYDFFDKTINELKFIFEDFDMKE